MASLNHQRDLQADLARLAAVGRELADLAERLGPNLAELLADLPRPRLMEPVDKKPAPSGPEILTSADLAKLLRIDERTLRAMRRSGEAPEAIRIGTRPRWRRGDVESWLAKRGAP